MNPVLALPSSHQRARRILIAAIAVQSFFFLLSAKECLATLFSAPTSPVYLGAAVIGIDSHGYYAWLRSPLADGDLNFDNEFSYYEQITPGVTYPGRTPIGKHINQWSVGPALVWAVGVIPVHAVLGVFGLRGEGMAEGYTPWYQFAVLAVTFALSVATLLLVYSTARRFAAPVASAIAASGVVLGSTLLAYGTAFPGMAHGPAAAAVALFVYVWIRTLGGRSAWRWFGLGVLLGVACLMRWQLATFSVLLALECAWGCFCGTGLQTCGRRNTGLETCATSQRPPTEPISAKLRLGGLLTLAAVGTVVGFIPQMIGWQLVYGSPLVSQHNFSVNRLLDSPALWTVLGSTDRGFFYWTPITLVAVLGGCFAIRRAGTPVAFLLFAAAVQIYAMAALVNGNIGLAWSFGFRFLTETCVVLVPGFAVFLDHLRPRKARVLAMGVCVLVGWNVLLLCGTRIMVVTSAGSATPLELLQQVGKSCVRRPLEPLLALPVWIWFAAVVIAGTRQRALPITQPITVPRESRKAA